MPWAIFGDGIIVNTQISKSIQLVGFLLLSKKGHGNETLYLILICAASALEKKKKTRIDGRPNADARGSESPH